MFPKTRVWNDPTSSILKMSKSNFQFFLFSFFTLLFRKLEKYDLENFKSENENEKWNENSKQKLIFRNNNVLSCCGREREMLYQLRSIKSHFGYYFANNLQITVSFRSPTHSLTFFLCVCEFVPKTFETWTQFTNHRTFKLT